MDIHDFKAGTWGKSYGFKYFVPEKINHEFTCQDSTVTALLERASIKLGELNSFARFVPNTNLFISMHVHAYVNGADSPMTEVEVWSYPPMALSRGPLIDRLSLYLSLRGTTDERVESALDELLEGMKCSADWNGSATTSEGLPASTR